MKEMMKKSWLVVFIGLGWMSQILNANIGEWDEVWKKRAQESWNRTLDTYEPIPEHIVSHLNVNAKR